MSYQVLERMPSVAEFMGLRQAVGWQNAAESAIAIALRNSLFGVCVASEQHIVGCGRIIGDGGINYYIQDIVVHPEHQGFGVGTLMMQAIMGYFEKHAVAGAFIGLMAAKGMEGFYQRLGFSQRPSPIYGAGMCLVWNQPII